MVELPMRLSGAVIAMSHSTQKLGTIMLCAALGAVCILAILAGLHAAHVGWCHNCSLSHAWLASGFPLQGLPMLPFCHPNISMPGHGLSGEEIKWDYKDLTLRSIWQVGNVGQILTWEGGGFPNICKMCKLLWARGLSYRLKLAVIFGHIFRVHSITIRLFQFPRKVLVRVCHQGVRL